MSNSLSRRQVLQGLSAAALPLGAFSCAHTKPDALVVGGLPVTCNLTLPVACVAKAASNSPRPPARRNSNIEYSKYNGWPEIKESLMAGRIQAAYMLAPLVMDLADKGIPVKIVSLGHRSGAVIMVRTDSPYQHFRELAGKRIAIPSRFAVDFLFLRRMLAQENMDIKDVRSSRWRRPTCRRRCTRTRSMPTAPASRSARRRRAPATRGRCA